MSLSGIDLSRAEWRKSSRSGGNGGQLEVAHNLTAVVAVRDSKDRHGGTLIFSRRAWAEFIDTVRHQTAMP
jgi:Domain of unknown function (DUF397)